MDEMGARARGAVVTRVGGGAAVWKLRGSFRWREASWNASWKLRIRGAHDALRFASSAQMLEMKRTLYFDDRFASRVDSCRRRRPRATRYRYTVLRQAASARAARQRSACRSRSSSKNGVVLSTS